MGLVVDSFRSFGMSLPCVAVLRSLPWQTNSPAFTPHELEPFLVMIGLMALFAIVLVFVFKKKQLL